MLFLKSIAAKAVRPEKLNTWYCRRSLNLRAKQDMVQAILSLMLLSAFFRKRLPGCLGFVWLPAIVLMLIALPLFLSAQPLSDSVTVNNKLPAQFSISLGVQYGFIFAHSVDVQNTKGARPVGIETIVSWQRNDAATFALCNCYPRMGLLLAYYDYDSGILGKSGTAAYFLEPTYRITDRLLLSFKGAAGLSYLTNPFDSLDNPANQSYSTHISAYLLVGIGSWIKLSDNWWLNPGINYQHISNGGMRKPNKGINWPTAGIAVSYQPNSRPLYRGARGTDKFWKSYSTRWDISLLGSRRRGYDQDYNRQHFLLGGVALQACKQVGRMNMLTLGSEIYHDEELRDKLRQQNNPASATKAALLAGHEFILGRFLFSQRLGVYVFDEARNVDRLHHRWGLQYRVNRHFSAGFNLLAQRQVAEFVDFRLTYTFRKRYEQDWLLN